AQGQPVTCRLTAIDDAWQITCESASGRSTLPAAEVAWWGAPAALRSRRGIQATDHALVVLADGGILPADVLEAADGQFSLGSLALGELTLRQSRIRGIVFRPPADLSRR